ncbi:MAG: Smr/MutS family protein [candidate division KSB1 bacterium]|nr:Smr/MutS family protein [candidate division KSB1 bacterium]
MKSKKSTSQHNDEAIPEFFVVTDTLDLHGFFPEQVPEMIHDFIDNALKLKLTQLRIVHGKGKSKLKYMVRKELENNPHVAWFGDARPEFGGWGATVVILNPLPENNHR